MSSSVARLHRALVEAIRKHRPNLPNGTVTVAEIYQDLVPYRSVRSALGFALNADYEHALLQLLAGVENRARIEPAEAREALRLELESPNPNTGVFRGYAACDVIVAQLDDAELQQVEAVPTAAGRSTTTEPARAVAVVEPANSGAARLSMADAGSQVAGNKRVTDTPTVSGQSGECRSCRRTLPTERGVRFCPYCGADQKAVSCSACGEQLDAGWKYCIACGESVRRQA